jgi:hypothetical protein
VTSFLAELLLYPAAYKLWKRKTEPLSPATSEGEA